MSERKYTDEEIVKALECCAINCSCDGCPADYKALDDICSRYIKRLALDLINRQKAEIERLNIELDAMRGAANSYKMHCEKGLAEKEAFIKNYAECAKEFAEEVIRDIIAILQAKFREHGAEDMPILMAIIESIIEIKEKYNLED